MDGAVHRAAGQDLLRECCLLAGCKTGEAKLTKGYQLRAEYIIHTVGPVWRGGANNEPELLASCYRSAIDIATAVDISTLAFPSISTGVYRYPVGLAARVAVATVRSMLQEHLSIQKIVFCCFSASDLAIYEDVLNETAA